MPHQRKLILPGIGFGLPSPMAYCSLLQRTLPAWYSRPISSGPCRKLCDKRSAFSSFRFDFLEGRVFFFSDRLSFLKTSRPFEKDAMMVRTLLETFACAIADGLQTAGDIVLPKE